MSENLQLFPVSDDIKKIENAYVEVRGKENRLYTDAAVRELPRVEITNRYFNEWSVREESFRRLKEYLSAKKENLMILDLGCGNGWLANGLSEIENTKVIAFDINIAELSQGARVFGNNHNLLFIYGDIFDPEIQLPFFDVIVLASSVQYFPGLPELINRLLGKLKSNGEIHIIDSPVYNNRGAVRAKERSRSYYRNLGFEAMAEYYHHHTFEELRNFNYRIYRGGIWERMKNIPRINRRGIFPWIVVKKINQAFPGI